MALLCEGFAFWGADGLPEGMGGFKGLFFSEAQKAAYLYANSHIRKGAVFPGSTGAPRLELHTSRLIPSRMFLINFEKNSQLEFSLLSQRFARDSPERRRGASYIGREDVKPATQKKKEKT